MHRKRAGLSQRELAYLLGSHFPAAVSRYERFGRGPSLETALALEAILGVSVRELFAGTYDSAEREVKRRARRIERRLVTQQRSPDLASKLARLKAITTTDSDDVRYEPLPDR